MLEDFAKLVIEAWPWLEGVVGVARVVVTALPQYGAVVISVVTTPWFMGILGAGFLVYAWRELA